MATLKELRIARRLTQGALAQRAGVSPVTINRMENGAPVNHSTLKLVAQVLEVGEEEIDGVTIADRIREA